MQVRRPQFGNCSLSMVYSVHSLKKVESDNMMEEFVAYAREVVLETVVLSHPTYGGVFFLLLIIFVVFSLITRCMIYCH